MELPKNILDKIQKIYSDNPQGLNIIEEQIDLDIQMNYFKRSGMLKKHVFSFDEILEKLPILYDPDARLEEKRDELICLASFDNVEAFRILEKFKEESEGEIKLWAAMAYRESKMLLESSLLDEDQILISTGLGGKGTRLRYFVCLVHRNEEPYTDVQEKLIREEFESSAERSEAEIESLVFENQYVKVSILIPINASVKSVVDPVIEVGEEFGDFIDEHVIITNVRTFTNDEINDIVHDVMSEDDIIDIDELDAFPIDDYTADLDDDDEDGDVDDDDTDDEDL